MSRLVGLAVILVAGTGCFESRAPGPTPAVSSASPAPLVPLAQKTAGPRYDFRDADLAGHDLLADNPAQTLRVRAGRRGIAIASATHPWAIGLRLHRVGRPGDMRPAAPIEERIARGNRIAFERASGVEEWYVNGPLGLEQGFELSERPAPRGGGALVLEVAVTGNLQPAAAGGSIGLRAPTGRRPLECDRIRVEDAAGRPVPAHLETRGRRIAMVVHDDRAQYPLTVDPMFSQRQRLTASDAEQEEYFARSVAMTGDTAVFGVPRDDRMGVSDAGAAYVFTRSGGRWSQASHLTPGGAASQMRIGEEVAIDSQTALVASRKDQPSSSDDGGAVYVYVESGTNGWNRQAKLTDPSSETTNSFADDVAIDGDTALISAWGATGSGPNDAGAVYLFVRASGAWNMRQKLTASDRSGGDNFGTSVGIDGNYAVAGAPYADPNRKTNAGAAYVFERSGGSWSQSAKLTPSDGAAEDAFGHPVAIDGDTIVVGARLHDHGGVSDAGAAYVFERDNGTWQQRDTLFAHALGARESFPTEIGVSGDRIVVGDWKDDRGGSLRRAGAAYVYHRDGDPWNDGSKLTASDADSDSNFGFDVATAKSTILVGAFWNSFDGKPAAGSAYVFTSQPTDSDGDGVIDSSDNCPMTKNPSQPDADIDGVGDACDNCPMTENASQTDSDSDGTGDACDGGGGSDADGDGVDDASDNCPMVKNSNQTDTDGDGVGDVCESCASTTCPGGESCYRARCYPSCQSDGECGEGERCIGGTCRKSNCSNVDCPMQETCYRGTCYPQCRADGDCDAGERCIDGSCRATDCSGVTCAVNETCYRGTCYPQCKADGDCGAGERCVDGGCHEVDCSDVTCRKSEVCYRGSCYPECQADGDCDGSRVCRQNACLRPQSGGGGGCGCAAGGPDGRSGGAAGRMVAALALLALLLVGARETRRRGGFRFRKGGRR